MSKEYASFLDPLVQKENYLKIGIDKSVAEINQILFWEQNKHFFEMKDKYKEKPKGVKLKNNQKMDIFLKTSHQNSKFKREPIKVSFKNEKREPDCSKNDIDKETKKVINE